MSLNISHRLSVGFAELVFLTILLGTSSIMKMHAISESTTKLYRHPLAVGNAVRDIRTNIIAMLAAMDEVTLAENTVEIQIISDKLNHMEQTVLASFDIVF